MSRRIHARSWAALVGIVSAGAFLAASALVALIVDPTVNPLLAVGGFVIDIVPQPVKEFAITAFGTWDKAVLLGSLGLAGVLGAAIAGILQLRRPPTGVALLAIACAGATAAVLTRAGASALSLIPPVVGAIVACGLLVELSMRLRRWAGSTDGAERGPGDRRRFLVATGVSAAAAVLVGVGATMANGVRTSIASARRALRLPEPAGRVPVPAGAELEVDGISPLFTPNAEFYRVDTALDPPRIDPGTWRLTIDGMVDEEIELTFDDLVERGLDEYAITLTCVSNEVGGDLVGTAKWWGVPVRDLLRLAVPHSDADMVLSRSVDGFTASTPLEALTDDGRDAILAVAMNGEPLPVEHGFPVRMVVPGLYGYVSATKWLERLTVTTFADDEAYWTPRGYSARAPIKFASRIDTPRAGSRVDAGTVALAGVAWAQTVGIERVEVSIDDGDWQKATLSTPVNTDTWVQWMLEWEATPGTHFATVRAVNRDGELQVQDRTPIAPDGATGWQRILVTVV
ncbi:sulfite oxidase [Microbacterium awajiense]|uniref:Sulfite oxidase n=1 Tax=Microbacterium awajiense TaxID=415214 RepID=A0ABP7AM57_9MICO